MAESPLTSDAVNQAPDVTPDDILDEGALIAAPWPELDPTAYHGLAGEIVRLIEPQTESDPVALLMQLLVMVGNAIGRAPYFPVEADRHHLNLFTCLAGESSRGRKGTSAGHPRRLLAAIDPAWSQRLMGGLSSGEGIIWHVRDAVSGHNKHGDEVCLDEGVEDKRLCILETEFARALAKTGQEGNVLSAVLRQAWDHGDLRTLVSGRQKAPVAASHAHISVIAHITVDEVQRLLTETEVANGFGNRFLWVCVRRSKLLPRGGLYPEQPLKPLSNRLANAIVHARKVAQMRRTPASEKRWEAIYTALAEGYPGLLGAITARAEAQVLRLSCLYALFDQTDTVDVPHLEAAYALWRYCDASARYIFGTMLGHPLADHICTLLRQMAPEGMTRTALNDALGGHHKSAAITQALSILMKGGYARHAIEKTSGRPTEWWFAHTHVSIGDGGKSGKSPAMTAAGGAQRDTLNPLFPPSPHASQYSDMRPKGYQNGVVQDAPPPCAHEHIGRDAEQFVCHDCGESLGEETDEVII